MALSRGMGSLLMAVSLAMALASLFLPGDLLDGWWHRASGSGCPLVGEGAGSPPAVHLLQGVLLHPLQLCWMGLYFSFLLPKCFLPCP